MILSIIHATIPFTPSSVPVNVGNVDLRKIPHFNVWHGNVQDVEKDVEKDVGKMGKVSKAMQDEDEEILAFFDDAICNTGQLGQNSSNSDAIFSGDFFGPFDDVVWFFGDVELPSCFSC